MLVPAHKICSLSLCCRDKEDFIHVSPFQDSFSWCGWFSFVTENMNTWNSHRGIDHALGRCSQPSLRGVKHFLCVSVCIVPYLSKANQILWDGSSRPWHKDRGRENARLSFVKAGGHCCDLIVEFWALQSLSSNSGFLTNPRWLPRVALGWKFKSSHYFS